MANINDYVSDGFVKVCDVCEDYKGDWYYKNIVKEVMFDEHDSWIYFIVVDNAIVKCGETGNPLGIALTKKEYNRELQPITGTASRLGRLRSNDGTDTYIRKQLHEDVANERVSIWARRCEKVITNVTIAGKKHTTKASIHKDLELDYLQHFVEVDYQLPLLNKAHK
jgi:hypothetical protein